MSKTTVAAFISVCVLAFAACVKDSGRLITSQTTTTVSACDTITYTKHIKPIIDSSCISCHSSNPVPNAPPLTNYAEAKANGTLIKTTTVDGTPKPMPDGGDPLPAAKKQLIICWVTNGMKE